MNHLFAGNSYNTKKLLHSVYEELNRAKGVPLRTFDDAFQLRSYITNKRLNASTQDDEQQCFSFNYLFENVVKATFRMINLIAKQMNNSIIMTDEVDLAHLLEKSTLLQEKINSIQVIIQGIFNMYKSPEADAISVLDVSVATIKGILDDNLSENGFDNINHLDLRAWLAKHGVNTKTLQSAFVKFQYDVLWAYRNGNIEEPDLEAGTGLRIFLTFNFCLPSNPYFKQQAGDGDVAFAPVYEVLRKRGVHFKFFHKVEELNLNINNPKLVEQIRVTKQVELENDEYNTLINVKGLPSWPNEPKYEEIGQEQANLLKKHDIDLESFWTRWPSIYKNYFK